MAKEDNRLLSEQDTQPLDLSEFQTTHYPYTRVDENIVRARRRFVKGLGLPILFPSEQTSNPQNIEIAREMRRNGVPMIIAYTHPDRRSSLDAIRSVVALGEGFEDAVILSPIAVHQDKRYIHAITDRTGIELMPIVTTDTIDHFNKKHEKQHSLLQKAGDIFKKGETEEQLPQLRQGVPAYTDRGGEVIANELGLVLGAFQGGRRNSLDKPAGRGVELLVRSARRKGADRLAIWPMSILPKGVTEFNEKTSGLRVARRELVEFGTPRYVEDLEAEAAANGINLDEQVFVEQAMILPPYYTQGSPYASLR